MQYISTRGGLAPQSFSEVVLMGLAPDGGLVIPETLPQISMSELNAWRSLSYSDLAYEIIARFATDIPQEALRNIIRLSYQPSLFEHPELTPLRRIDSQLYLLDLSQGPSLAFKDIALQFLANLLQHILAQRQQCLNILGATSGDTGSAAEYAMRGKNNIRVFMLSGHQKMSPFQTAQMLSLQDNNIFNIVIEGVFDHCQDIVKTLTSDLAFKEKYQIGAVNSINLARIVAQIVYYFKAYLSATQSSEQLVDFAVPSGNFGNALAGYYAKCMGLPIRKICVATNENNVLETFFRTGIYQPWEAEKVRQTSSPSMDISKASNLERFIYRLYPSMPEPKATFSQWFPQPKLDLSAILPHIHQTSILAGTSTHLDRIKTIQALYQHHQTIIDPHTADGVTVGLRHQSSDTALICLETARAVKFAATIREALDISIPVPDQFQGIEQRPQFFKQLPADADAVKHYITQQLST